MGHVPHGEGSGFESGAGLSISSVRLSSPDGVLGDDTFFRHTFLGAGCVSTFTSCDAKISYAGFDIWHSSDCEA